MRIHVVGKQTDYLHAIDPGDWSLDFVSASRNDGATANNVSPIRRPRHSGDAVNGWPIPRPYGLC